MRRVSAQNRKDTLSDTKTCDKTLCDKVPRPTKEKSNYASGWNAPDI